MLTPEEKAEKLVRDVEVFKAKVYGTPGKNYDLSKQFHSMMVENDYLLVASHVDQNTLNKIVIGDFVDFSRLLPRDKIAQEEDQHLEVVVQGGHTYRVPAGDRDSQSIHSFGRWEQAFRVYSDIYLRSHPQRSNKLIQYNHIIYTASLTYVWENVYAYNKDFRLHMGRHPERSWGIILQQAWAMRLRDKLTKNDNIQYRNQGSKWGENSMNGDRQAVDVNNICWRCNRVRCSFEQTCRYDHRCSYCFKFGHSVLNCGKLGNERGQNRDRNDRQSSGGRSHHRDSRE